MADSSWVLNDWSWNLTRWFAGFQDVVQVTRDCITASVAFILYIPFISRSLSSTLVGDGIDVRMVRTIRI
jgi:hypothetical protein